jgi:hypothetical protein
LTVLTTSPAPDSAWRDLLVGCIIATFGLLFGGALAAMPLLVEAVRRRRWGMFLVDLLAWSSCFERSTTRLDPVGRFIHTRGSSRAS